MIGYDDRDVLFEMLVLESKGMLTISSRRVIEICCGWGDDTCDEELEYRKYLEAYHSFLSLYDEYVVDNVHEFGIIQMFEDVDDLMESGCGYREAVIRMIRAKFGFLRIPLAEPPCEYKGDCVYFEFDGEIGKIEGNELFFEIRENKNNKRYDNE